MNANNYFNNYMRHILSILGRWGMLYTYYTYVYVLNYYIFLDRGKLPPATLPGSATVITLSQTSRIK